VAGAIVAGAAVAGTGACVAGAGAIVAVAEVPQAVNIKAAITSNATKLKTYFFVCIFSYSPNQDFLDMVDMR
jgi:hypothetical protein